LSLFLALADSRFEGKSTLPPQAGNASRWAAGFSLFLKLRAIAQDRLFLFLSACLTSRNRFLVGNAVLSAVVLCNPSGFHGESRMLIFPGLLVRQLKQM
jgi:hypothetical protein